MTPNSARLVLLASCTCLIAACEKDQTPTTPILASPTLQAVSSGAGSAISEQLQAQLAYQDPGFSRLAPTTTIRGNAFALRLTPTFDRVNRVLTLQVSIQNLTSSDVWRPLRAEVVAFKPDSIWFLEPDNGAKRLGGTWDYGQTTGPDGKLVPGEMSLPRTVRIQVLGKDEASLHSLKLTLKLDGKLNPEFPPTPARDPTPAEAEAGFGAGMLLVRYKAGILSREELSQLNVRFGLAGQDYHSDVLGEYTVFTEDPSFEATRAVRDLLRSNEAVEAALLATLFYPVGSDALPTEIGNDDDFLKIGQFPLAWSRDISRGRSPGENVLVGILDSGINPESDEFKEQIGNLGDGTRGVIDCRFDKDCEPKDPTNYDPTDHKGHGTKVAGVVAAAANNLKVVGGAYGAKIVSIKILGADYEQQPTYPQAIINGLDFVRRHPEISIVNISWGL